MLIKPPTANALDLLMPCAERGILGNSCKADWVISDVDARAAPHIALVGALTHSSEYYTDTANAVGRLAVCLFFKLKCLAADPPHCTISRTQYGMQVASFHNADQ